ncbi:MAG TPA: IS21-like element helper ATPase IstB [Gammaproteobacteria bacterium]
MSFAQACEVLRRLGLHGMAQSLDDLQVNPAALRDLALSDLVIKLGEGEQNLRSTRRLKRLLKAAGLRGDAYPEDIDYRVKRGLDRQLMADLLSCDWIRRKQNLFIIGPTGVGKTWIAEAMVSQACRNGMPAAVWRVSKLLSAINVGRGDGSAPKLHQRLAKLGLLVLDDWGRVPLTVQARHDLLELVDDRCERGSIAITSQHPVDKWYDWLNDATVADALLDRIVHKAHKINLKGDSMRALKGMG